MLALRSWVSLRETAKHYFMHGYAVIRRLLQELDQRFHLDGGIFFLTADEMPRLLQADDVHTEVDIRRRRHRLVQQIEVPEVIFSTMIWIRLADQSISVANNISGDTAVTRRRGGQAIVLNDPANKPPSEPYVLVCPSTDPAWVPCLPEQ